MITAGFRAHLGWADAVTLRGVPDDPAVVDRRRLDLGTGRAHPYGAAAAAAPEDRQRALEEAMHEAELAATDALLHLTSELDIEAGGIVVSREVLLRIPIERVLTSTSLYHTASGAAYQRALQYAFDNLGLRCVTVEFSEAEDHPAWPVVAALGREIGPPWRKDHKWAAVAAWVAAAG